MYGVPMWWNDIREIKEGMGRLTERLGRIDYTIQKIHYHEQEKSEVCMTSQEMESLLQSIKDSIDDIELVNDSYRENRMLLTEEVLVKIDAIYKMICDNEEKKKIKRKT